MPGGDRTGPIGMGPLTKGGRGTCFEEISTLGTWQRPFAGRFNQSGRYRGFRNFYCSAGLPGRKQSNQLCNEVESIDTLKSQASKIQVELSLLLERINTLEKS
ncbi:MAG: DUF5320 domain-containing protein [Candidatus Omnitrophica bacterium]|nr:DUF5320 domain-containing protein [Candidatus Omnitrophota bacterium]MBU1997310.1 DUF5320 domain-containing protein [Candidatus Omnitrophota bacterium]MBU4332915.1 DUF5320 domain-containing protein [Candidatus Omnitrophota bacterium]